MVDFNYTFSDIQGNQLGTVYLGQHFISEPLSKGKVAESWPEGKDNSSTRLNSSSDIFTRTAGALKSCTPVREMSERNKTAVMSVRSPVIVRS